VLKLVVQANSNLYITEAEAINDNSRIYRKKNKQAYICLTSWIYLESVKVYYSVHSSNWQGTNNTAHYIKHDDMQGTNEE
jgi:hypothetical protein